MLFYSIFRGEVFGIILLANQVFFSLSCNFVFRDDECRLLVCDSVQPDRKLSVLRSNVLLFIILYFRTEDGGNIFLRSHRCVSEKALQIEGSIHLSQCNEHLVSQRCGIIYLK